MADGPKNHEIEDVDSEYQSARSRLGTVVALIIGLFLAGLLIFVVTKSFSGSRENLAKRMQLKQALAKFNADPTNDSYSREAADAYEAAGKQADAEKIRHRHEAAIKERDDKREQTLRARLTKNPRDGEAQGLLLEFLVEHDDVPGARAAYASFLALDPTPKRHAGYGTWLWRYKFTEEAVAELTLALKGYDTPETQAYLGMALLDLGRKREAFPLLERAFVDKADIVGLREKYLLLAKEFNAEPKAPPPQP